MKRPIDPNLNNSDDDILLNLTGGNSKQSDELSFAEGSEPDDVKSPEYTVSVDDKENGTIPVTPMASVENTNEDISAIVDKEEVHHSSHSGEHHHSSDGHYHSSSHHHHSSDGHHHSSSHHHHSSGSHHSGEHHHHHHDGEECDDPECECHHHHHHHADDVFSSWGKETPKKFSKEALEDMLHKLDSGDYGHILRAKGIVNGEDGWLEFDYVPEEHEVRAGHPDYTGRLCVIGAELKEDGLAELFGV